MVFHPQMETRCGSCHRSSVFNTKLQKEVPAWRFGTTTDKDDRYTDPGAVVNLSYPEDSLVLRAPLARSAASPS